MEACHNRGLTKHIGVSNYTVALLLDLLAYAEMPPTCLQVELHPYLKQSELVQFC